jgi:hypothetical protein
MFVLTQHKYQSSAALLQGNCHTPARKPTGQVYHELLNRFWRMFQIALLDARLTLDPHRPAVFLIRPINTDPHRDSILCHLCLCPFLSGPIVSAKAL